MNTNGLRQYQIEDLKFLLAHNGRVLIASEPGVGKTVNALSFLRESPNHLPAIIICPANTKLQWLKMGQKWLSLPRLGVLYGTTPHPIKQGYSVIINWDILADWMWELSRCKFKTIIGDEAHRLAYYSAIRTRATSYLVKRVPYFIPMSGTPIRSKPGQFFPMLNMLEPKIFPSFQLFRERYCNLYKDSYTGRLKEAPGGKHLDELNSLLKNIMIRREKKDVLKDLPKCSRIVVPLEIDMDEYTMAEHEMRENVSYNLKESKEAIRKLMRTAFMLKRMAVVDWIKDFLESGKKLLVFGYHHSVLDYLEESFPKICVRVDGRVTGNKREQAIQSFMKEKQLLVGNIQAMGEALDGLQNVCSYCCFVEFANSFTEHIQAEGRLDRSGQKEPVSVYYLTAANSVDSDSIKILNRQAKTVGSIMQGKATIQADILMELYRKYRREIA